MKTPDITLTINVPASWLDQLDEKELKTAVEKFMSENAPCEYCGGEGFVESRQWPDPDSEEIGCEHCNHTPWENPL